MSGLVLSFEKAQAVLKSIKSLQASGIDGMFPLGELIKHCRNPSHIIPEHEEETLKRYGLVQPDGSVGDTVRNVVLSGTYGGNFFDHG